jgi:hypothetical protein
LAGRVGLTETRSARDCAAAPDTLEAPKPGFTRRFSSAVSPTRRSPRRRRFGISASSPTSTGLTDGSIHGEHSQYRSAGRAGGRIMYAPPPAPEAIPRPTAPSRRIVCQRRLQLCVSGVLAGFPSATGSRSRSVPANSAGPNDSARFSASLPATCRSGPLDSVSQVVDVFGGCRQYLLR